MGDESELTDTTTGQWFARLLLLMPGFLAIGLARYIGALGQVSDFELTLYSFSLSLPILLLATVTRRVWHALRSCVRQHRHFPERSGAGPRAGAPPPSTSPMIPICSPGWRARSNELPTVSWIPPLTLRFYALSLFLAVLTGLLIAISYDNDSLLLFARSLFGTSVSKRSSQRPLTFLLSSNRRGDLEEGRPEDARAKQAWVDIVSEGDGHFAGFPEFFAMGKEPSELYLSPACTVNDAGFNVAIEGPGVLIPEEKIIHIEFLDQRTSACRRLWNRRYAVLACLKHYCQDRGPRCSGRLSTTSFEFGEIDQHVFLQAVARRLAEEHYTRVEVKEGPPGLVSALDGTGVAITASIAEAHDLVMKIELTSRSMPRASEPPFAKERLCEIGLVALEDAQQPESREQGGIALKAGSGYTTLPKEVGTTYKTGAFPTIAAYAQFAGAATRVRTKERLPMLALFTTRDPSDEYILVRLTLDDQKSARRVRMTKVSPQKETSDGIVARVMLRPDPESIVPIVIQQESPAQWKISPATNLEPGEYGLWDVAGFGLAAFGVDK